MGGKEGGCAGERRKWLLARQEGSEKRPAQPPRLDHLSSHLLLQLSCREVLDFTLEQVTSMYIICSATKAKRGATSTVVGQ